MINYLAGFRSPKEIETFENCYDTVASDQRPLFENILFSIASVGRPTRLEMVKFLDERRVDGRLKNVALDSGGYQVAKGKLSVDAMMEMDRQIYSNYQNFDAYFLPDEPVFSNDDIKTAEMKVEKNISMATELFETLPDKVKKKCVPIFHLQNIGPIERQIEGFRPIVDQSRYIAIGSIAIKPNFDLKVRLVTELLRIYGPDIKIHSLGDGNTKRLLALNMVGVYSNDTTSHFITAAIGKATMPYIGVVYLDDINGRDWKGIQKSVDHTCEFCYNFKSLKKDLVYRKIHNCLVYRDLEKQYKDAGQEELSNDFYYLKNEQQELF